MYRRRKKKGNLIILTCVVLAFIALSYGYFLNENKPEKQIVDINDDVVKDPIQENAQEVNTSETDLSNKVKEDALIVFNTYYVKTGEIITREVEIPHDAVGMTLSEFKNYVEINFDDYTIRSISSEYAKLFRQVNGYNPNYHVIKSDEDRILIYIINEDGEYIYLDDTGLTTANLGEADKDKLKEGIVVETIEEVYNIIEDFSS